MTEDTMQIGKLADRTGMSIRSLRHYDEIGLLVPSARTEGGFRLYTFEDEERLLLIRRMKPLGYSLEQMRELLDVVDELEAHPEDTENRARCTPREGLENRGGQGNSARPHTKPAVVVAALTCRGTYRLPRRPIAPLGGRLRVGLLRLVVFVHPNAVGVFAQVAQNFRQRPTGGDAPGGIGGGLVEHDHAVLHVLSCSVIARIKVQDCLPGTGQVGLQLHGAWCGFCDAGHAVAPF